MRPLDVAVVANNIRRRDGEGRVMLEISRSLLGRGHRVTAFSTTCADEILKHERSKWVRVAGLPGPDMIRHFTFAIASTFSLRSRRFDVVVTMGPCGFSRDPVVIYSAFTQRGWQGSWSSMRPDLYRRMHSASAKLLESRAFPRASGVLPISRSVRDELDDVIAHDALVRIVPGGVDLEEFGSMAKPDSVRSALGIDPGGFVVALVGEFATGRKGLHRMIEAASLDDDPNEVLLVHGSGPIGAARSKARALGLPDRRMVFAPFDLPVRDVLAASDVVAIPSTYEPFSLVALEAGACGKPLVISDLAGAAKPFTDAGGAISIDPTDAAALRSALDKLKHDAGLRREMGEKAQQVASGFTWPAVAAEAVDAIEQVAAGSSGAN